MSGPKVTIVCHYFAPSAATGALRSTRLARFLAARGLPPQVVTADPRFYSDAVLPASDVRSEFTVREVRAESIPRLLRAGGARGNLGMALAYRRLIEQALRTGPATDLLYFCGHPFWYFPLARQFHLRYGTPYMLDFADLFHMERVRYRMGERTGLRTLTDARAEAWAVAGAARLIHTTPAQTHIYRRRYAWMAPERFLTIPWGYDEDQVPRIPDQRGSPEGLRIGIFGKFASYSRADAVMLARAVRELPARLNVTVLHIGRREPELEGAFRAVGASKHLQCVGMLSYAEGLKVLATAHCVALNAISDVSLPAKVYDYVWLNRPVLAFAPPQSEVARLLRPFPGAFLVRSAQQALAALVRVAAGARELAPALDRRRFSQQRQFERLLSELMRVTGKEA